MRTKEIDLRPNKHRQRDIREAYFELMKELTAMIPVVNELELREKPLSEIKIMKKRLREFRNDVQDFETEFSQKMAQVMSRKT